MKLPPMFTAGFQSVIGSHHFTAEEIIAFARKYDPQPFHIDAEKARNSLFGGLCASGWHTISMWMRYNRIHSEKMVRDLQAQGAGILEIGPSPGFEQLRWIRPVYAGDTITFSNETIGTRPSGSRPGWYLFTAHASGKNQESKPVISVQTTAFIAFSEGPAGNLDRD
jgi:acyl dehydratase